MKKFHFVFLTHLLHRILLITSVFHEALQAKELNIQAALDGENPTKRAEKLQQLYKEVIETFIEEIRDRFQTENYEPVIALYKVFFFKTPMIA